MSTLYAVLVAINHYPDPRHELEGCLQDRLSFQQYLETWCRQLGRNFQPLVLEDQEATREGVIAAFNHFRMAGSGDTCLFYYAGHGGRCPAPAPFNRSKADGMMESIVCWDSRQPGGRDLMDKEISFLIWDVLRDKTIPLITITDSCHSGNLRGPQDRIRQLPFPGAPVTAESFLGIEHYKQDADGQRRPPHGRRIHLAAARDHETAKEVCINGVGCGIFTYCLIEVLNDTGPLISYMELVRRVNLRVRGVIGNQSPQLSTTNADDKRLSFLSLEVLPPQNNYLAMYDRALGWVLNAGTMHGIVSHPDVNTTIEIPELPHTIGIVEVLATRTRIDGMEACDRQRIYPAVIRKPGKPCLRLAISTDSEVEAIAAIRRELLPNLSDLLTLHEERAAADFVLHAHDNMLFLSRTFENFPLFQRVEGYSRTAITLFLQQVGTVAGWQQVLSLQNPDTTILENELRMELFRITQPGNFENDAPVEMVDWQSNPLFTYNAHNKPAFQLLITNTGTRPLWVGILYLSHNFDITNQLLPKQLLDPGQQVWASYMFNAYSYYTIPLQIEEDYVAAGLSSIDEYIKVLACTEEIETELFVQQGLRSERAANRSRNRYFRKRPAKPDWRAFDINLTIRL